MFFRFWQSIYQMLRLHHCLTIRVHQPALLENRYLTLAYSDLIQMFFFFNNPFNIHDVVLQYNALIHISRSQIESNCTIIVLSITSHQTAIALTKNIDPYFFPLAKTIKRQFTSSFS